MVTIDLGQTEAAGDGDTPSTKAAGVIAKLGCAGFCAVFVALGLGFAYHLATDFSEQLGTRAWDEVPCTIEHSRGIVRGDGDYVLEVRYRYVHQGRELVGRTLELDANPKREHYADVQRRVDHYQPGVATTCWVDPANSERSLLERRSLWAGLAILLPLALAAAAAVGLVAVLSWKSAAPEPVRAPSSQATAKTAANAIPPIFGIPFFGAFLLAGIFAFEATYLRPNRNASAAESWPTVPCVVERSWVATHTGDDSTTYSAHALFAYVVDGRERKADTIAPSVMSTSDHAHHRHNADRYRPGTRTTCRYNPDDPAQAYIEPQGAGRLLGLFTLVFVAVGLAGLWWTIGGMRRRTPAEVAANPGEADAAPAAWAEAPARSHSPARAAVGRGPTGTRSWLPSTPVGGPAALSPVSKRIGMVVGMLLVGVFWNGIVGVFVWQIVAGFQKGDPSWFLTVFMVPFVLIGLAIVLGFFYHVLAILNPVPRLQVSEMTPRLGETIEVGWRFGGGVGRITRFSIALVGTELATYRRGTSTTTDRHPFARLVVAESDYSLDIAEGTARFTIPPHFMHSLDLANNKIAWKLVVSGAIAMWPDIDDHYPLAVLPAARTS